MSLLDKIFKKEIKVEKSPEDRLGRWIYSKIQEWETSPESGLSLHSIIGTYREKGGNPDDLKQTSYLELLIFYLFCATKSVSNANPSDKYQAIFGGMRASFREHIQAMQIPKHLGIQEKEIFKTLDQRFDEYEKLYKDDMPSEKWIKLGMGAWNNLKGSGKSLSGMDHMMTVNADVIITFVSGLFKK